MLNRILLVLVVFLCLINNLLPEVNAVSTTPMSGSGSGGNTGGGSGTGGNTGGGSGTGGNTGGGSGTGGNTGSGSGTGGNTGSGSGGNTGSGSSSGTGSVTTTQQQQSGSGNPTTTQQQQSGTGGVTTTQQQQSGSGNPTTTQQQQSGTGGVTTTQQQQSGSGGVTTTQGQQSGSGSGSGNPTTTQGQQSGSGSGSGNPTTTQGQQSGSGSGSGGQTGSSGSTTSPTTSKSDGETTTTTTQGSSYTGFTNSICEKNSEPSGECSLLLQLEVETEFPITTEGQLFSIYKEAWRDIANIASNLGVGSISLYVEFLKFVVLNNTNNVYEYAYEVDVALFESSCSQVTTWFNIFSNYGSAFLNDINGYIASSSLNFTDIGFGDTIIVQGTLSERASDGTIKNETSFQTNSAENNYVSKNIFIMMGLAMVSLLML